MAKKANSKTVQISSARVSAKGKAKTDTKRTISPKTQPTTSFQSQLSSFFASLRANNTTSNNGPRIKKKYLLPLIGLVVLLGLIWLVSRYLVIAWVDQKPISRIAYYDQLDKKYGKDLREQLIVEALIDAEARKRGLSATDQEVKDEISKIETEQGGADKLDQVLQMQGLSRDELKKLVRLQILRQKMFADSGNVTDEEVNAYLVENKANLPETNPKDASAEANLKANVREQLRQQKLNATFSSWLKENLDSDRVIRL